MTTILAIGNSFSQDATTYLYDIAKAEGIELKVVNLYIGGCSLEMHWKNLGANAAVYDYELNGQETGRKISIKEALQEEKWDYVALQQVSSDSGILDTYYPYIIKIQEYVKEQAPQAEQLLHQTWAYEIDSQHPDFAKYHLDQMEMYSAVINTYKSLAEELSLKIISCGKVIQNLRAVSEFDYANGGISLCRDGFHMHFIYGRYAVAATWYEFILHQNILDNVFSPQAVDNETVNIEMINMIKTTVHNTVKSSLNG